MPGIDKPNLGNSLERISAKIILKVCIPHTLRDSFDYLPVDNLPIVGARVWVPFRNKQRLGFIIAHGVAEKEHLNLKQIQEIIDADAMITPPVLQLCEWISRYYQSPLSEVLPLAVPKKLREGKSIAGNSYAYFKLSCSESEALSRLKKGAVKQHALVSFLSQHETLVAKTTLLQHGFTTSQLATLQASNSIEEVLKPMPVEPITPKQLPFDLNDEQQYAVDTMCAALNSYQCFLLHGVTGSGKTEVYLQVIAKVLAQNKQVLILVPEIGLTPQLLTRFNDRFTHLIAVIHSNLNETERARAWQLAKENQVSIIIGTRASIFTPLPSLGLIIIDEEHDSSLKQMEGVRYSARDTALMRAHLANIPIILGSATPCLESINNSMLKKYQYLTITRKALATHPLSYQLVDLRNTPLNQGIAEPTLKQIKAHLSQNNQVLVFINRRGFAPILLCHQCGWMVECLHCDSHLTLHYSTQRLSCHHCGLQQRIPRHCKQCQSTELIPIGVGTQRIANYFQEIFPTTSLLRIDRDEVKKKHELTFKLDQIHRQEVQLIVGTQMLAKGHDFPNLTLVVILDADYGFYNQDFRALEQLGQLFTQVAGRAGRASRPGHVVIQTHLPSNPLLKLLIKEGYDAFAKALLLMRKEASLPPFSHLAIIRAQHSKHSMVEQFLSHLKNFLQQHAIQVLGPAPAPLARKANQYRMQLLLKSPSRKQLHHSLTALRNWLTLNNTLKQVRWNIDVDPLDLS